MNKKIIIGISLGAGFMLMANALYTSTTTCTFKDGTPGTLVELAMGDWSCDGHCITQERNICSNLNTQQMKAAYNIAKTTLNFDLVNDVAEEYEDSSLKRDDLKKLRENGIATWKFDDEEENADEDNPEESPQTVTLDQDSYSEIYLQMVKLGDSNFRHETLEGHNLNIGGYGLFTQ